MKKLKKSWMALLLGALLMAILVGVAGARPIRQTTYKLTIPAAHFHPREDGYDWYNNGIYVRLVSGGSGFFSAALPIALPGRFTVEKITLFATDEDATWDVHAELFRMNPWTDTGECMGTISTSGQSGGMQVRSTTNIDPDTVYGGHGGYIMLYFEGPNMLLAVRAVQIEYH